ncbi:YoaK family protein [Mucilaginibacter koreensis]
MLKELKEKRTLKQNLMLASSTAFVAGMTNVVGVIAFLTFTSNVTGHVATLARHVVERNFHEIMIFFIWLSAFFMGAFTASFLIWSFHRRSKYLAHAAPIVLEIILLLVVAVYGHQLYNETDTEREIIITVLLFSMGLQNSMVSTISGGLIKTSHLSGLFTDFGSELAEWLHPRTDKTEVLRNKLYIRSTILSFYFAGGVTGGYLFNKYDFLIFYLIPVILVTIICYDMLPWIQYKLSRAVR